MKEAIFSAPGKILLLGGYSVLERPNIGYVLSVDKRVFVKSFFRKGKKIFIKIPQYKIEISGHYKKGKIIFEKELNEKEKEDSKFLRKGIEISINYLEARGKKIEGFEVISFNDPAFGIGKEKSGLGASAAVTVALVSSLFSLFGFSIKKKLELIHKLAQYIHFRVQGKVGSGFDVSTATFGSQKYIRFSPSIIKDLPDELSGKELLKIIEKKWDYVVEKTSFPSFFFPLFGNFLGESTSTSEMVKKVNLFKEKNPQKYQEITFKLNEENIKAIKSLEEIKNFYKKDPKKFLKSLREFKKSFEKGRLLTKKLGEFSLCPIEPNEFSKLIEETKKKGAFLAKLPGAGGGDAIFAICLSKENSEKVIKFWQGFFSPKIKIINLSIENEGVRKEIPNVFRKIKMII